MRIILALCCAMVFAGFVICLCAGDPSLANFHSYQTARALAEMPAGVLLVAGIALIIFEAR